MLDFESFDQVFAPVESDEKTAKPVRRLPKRKTLKEQIVFWTLNSMILPLVAICYLSIGADGLRQMMAGLSVRLHKLPIPGAEFLKDYSGFERLDVAMLAAIVLFVGVAILWVRVFRELQDVNELISRRRANPIRFILLVVIAAIIIVADAGIFWVGLSSQASSGWTDTPAYVPVAATVLYMAGLALVGCWHSDYHYSNRV